MSDVNRRWFYLIILSVIWGSSYILIKKGLAGFTAVQLWSVRVLMAGLLLMAIGWPSLRSIGKGQWKNIYRKRNKANHSSGKNVTSIYS